ncbi:U3 small nucleolar RNA-associated protein NOL7 [Aquarana catesbeiana]|uniref:U3 small nucleolar RNA-associated protein NOL7 n=1 Tax=Aquarana catesbeiana TaxID=8400 RepID=UPI003CC9EA9D
MTPELESENDEAPEEVTFQNARSQAEQNARTRREVAGREKTLLKEKRKRKQELFSEQKKKKLLSDDILQTITALPEKPDEPSEPTDETKGKEKEHGGKTKHAKKLRPRKSLQNNYMVVHLNDQNAIDLQQQKAKQFLQSTLYGKNKNRTTANEFLSISRKTGANKMPAVKFMDNSWGEEEKQKATKFNLRWRNRKKL